METLNKCIRYIFFGKTDVSYPSARKKKSDLNEVLPDNWSFIEDPLKKNLADYLIDNNITKSKEDQNFWLTNSSPPLTSFLDEYRMEKANSSVYNDEFKFCSAHWHTAKSELTQNNSVGNQTVDREVVKTSQPINIDMNPKIHDCYQAASQCSSKLEELKLRLSNKTRSKRDNKTYIRKPKKQFVEASLVEDGYEEPFESDDLDMMGNVDYIEFNNFGSVMYENLHQVDAALTKINDNSKQHKEMSTMKINKSDISDSDPMDTSSTVSKDKEGFPKEKRKRSRKKACKFFRIPSQNSDSEAASSFEQSPVMFMSHIDLPSSCDQTPSSLELPISFRQNLSSESLDNRKLSTTESEDSFIQFCDNGEDSCSESSVFDSNDEDYDSDSDSDVESGDITSALSKSVSNLTDDVLYAENTKTPLPDEDQVDCAKLEQEIEESKERKSAGILVNSAKKSAYKDKPQKTDNQNYSTRIPRRTDTMILPADGTVFASFGAESFLLVH
ncbi:hypothetical protein EVAR_34689_1 [Eumeta japonica]|uniref:Uncharacterized protein n=1 Tax=Eumeta variegata TaxID=151549 RepID=A0A4C1XG73_EUMVA|nr:hypothetical protein EVAR_34689_1 [Eumeta japonica]